MFFFFHQNLVKLDKKESRTVHCYRNKKNEVGHILLPQQFSYFYDLHLSTLLLPKQFT